jgi:RNA polymerase sigma factor (sigma-70 family)
MALMNDVDAGARWAPAFRALGDERLARLVEGGSDPAFSAIYGRYAPVLHGYCRSLLHDEEEAGDALQNAMLKALQAMRRAARTGPLRPWLFRIAHNESITIIRQRSRRPGALEENVVAGQADAFRHAAAREQLAALLRDLDGLTDHQRGAVVMRELGGLSYDEIAAALDTTPLAARQAVFAAKRKLDPEGQFSRKRLKLLLPPAPAGLALFGLFGGASGGVVASGGGKAIVAAVAAVSVGLGGVEIAEHVPAPVKERKVSVADTRAQQPSRARKRAAVAPAVAVATPTAVAARRAAAPRRAATTTAPVELVAVAYTPERATSPSQSVKAVGTPAPDRAAAPAPEPTAAPEAPRRDRDHREPRPQPAPQAAAPTPDPAPQQPARPVDGRPGQPHQGEAVTATAPGQTETRDARDCPPKHGDPAPDAAPTPAPSAVPVQ